MLATINEKANWLYQSGQKISTGIVQRMLAREKATYTLKDETLCKAKEWTRDLYSVANSDNKFDYTAEHFKNIPAAYRGAFERRVYLVLAYGFILSKEASADSLKQYAEKAYDLYPSSWQMMKNAFNRARVLAYDFIAELIVKVWGTPAEKQEYADVHARVAKVSAPCAAKKYVLDHIQALAKAGMHAEAGIVRAYQSPWFFAASDADKIAGAFLAEQNAKNPAGVKGFINTWFKTVLQAVYQAEFSHDAPAIGCTMETYAKKPDATFAIWQEKISGFHQAFGTTPAETDVAIETRLPAAVTMRQRSPGGSPLVASADVHAVPSCCGGMGAKMAQGI